MASHAEPALASAPAGWIFAPIHAANDAVPLRICLLLREDSDPAAGRLALLREAPGTRAYLGALCDVEGRVQEWVEIAVQSLELRDLAFSSYEERLTNHAFDQRWKSDFEAALAQVPERVVVTGLETRNPEPLLIIKRAAGATARFAPVEPAPWQLCRDDALLEKFGLPAYSSSPFRYLHQPGAVEEPERNQPKTFLATAADAPSNAHVQPAATLTASPEVLEVFNAHAGLIKVTRFSPIGLEDYLQVLEGGAWEGFGPGAVSLEPQGIYADFRQWSANQRGLPFMMQSAGDTADRLNEIFLLKLAALLSMFQEVRAAAKASQLPLLNLSPASFGVHLLPVGDQFPALWSAQCALVKPGQAHPLKIKSTEQRYFIRLGKSQPSAYLPEGLGAHSFGIGSIRRRNVHTEAAGVSLEGTLVAEDYLRLDSHDLLWFKLPIGEERVEFHAHVYTSEAVGPKEARFRTVPAKLPDAVVAALQNTNAFAKAPYEIWPLLSSPCDMHSLGIIAIRVLLANRQTNLPTLVDDVLGFARRLGKEPDAAEQLLPKLKAALETDAKFLDLFSPSALIESDLSPATARARIHITLWFETIGWLLRLFPGAGAQSYCRNYGDVSPFALETVFNRPVAELERLTLRLRSVLLPTLHANQEIANVLIEHLAATP